MTKKNDKTLAGPAAATLKIEWRDPRVLKPYDRNAKTHPPDQVDLIAAQISAFGFDQPIVILPDNVIIKGHGRREAALSIGLKKVPVVVTKLTAQQAAAARIGDNKVAESPWNEEMLKSEFKMLASAGYDVTQTGFGVTETQAIINAWSNNPPSIATVEETSDPGRAVIKIKCPFEHKDTVQKAIIKALEKTTLFGFLEFT